jgi:hypothetical protein
VALAFVVQLLLAGRIPYAVAAVVLLCWKGPVELVDTIKSFRLNGLWLIYIILLCVPQKRKPNKTLVFQSLLTFIFTFEMIYFLCYNIYSRFLFFFALFYLLLVSFSSSYYYYYFLLFFFLKNQIHSFNLFYYKKNINFHLNNFKKKINKKIVI